MDSELKFPSQPEDRVLRVAGRPGEERDDAMLSGAEVQIGCRLMRQQLEARSPVDRDRRDEVRRVPDDDKRRVREVRSPRIDRGVRRWGGRCDDGSAGRRDGPRWRGRRAEWRGLGLRRVGVLMNFHLRRIAADPDDRLVADLERAAGEERDDDQHPGP